MACFGLAKAGVLVAGMGALARRSLLIRQGYSIVSAKRRWWRALVRSGTRFLCFSDLNPTRLMRVRAAEFAGGIGARRQAQRKDAITEQRLNDQRDGPECREFPAAMGIGE